jgi:hypothetical protein
VSEARSEQYRRFVERAAEREDGYLFSEPLPRFRPEPGDELVAVPVTLGATNAGVTEIIYVQPVRVAGIERTLLEQAFKALRGGPQSYARLLMILGPDLEPFLDQTFGKVLFAPSAVAALEVELPSHEIVRFPGSPYEVVRSYWRNMVAVRRRIAQAGAVADAAELRELLLELHELALLGQASDGDRNSFYLPASALGRKRPEPGTFYETPSAYERRGDDLIITSGARVGVPLLGGEHYWQLLAESVSDPEALASERFVSFEGLELGRVVQGRAEGEERSRPWFLPPRPLLGWHFEALVEELQQLAAAEAERDVPRALSALAAFQYRLVRSHPLPSANQSISMCFVNAALGRLFGTGMPHLLLDQLALRFSLPAYQQLFARAARAWCAPWPNMTERSRRLLRLKGEMNAVVAELGRAPDLLQARALLAERPEGARAALLEL